MEHSIIQMNELATTNNSNPVLSEIYKYRYMLFGIWVCILGYTLLYHIITLRYKIKEFEKILLQKENDIHNEFTTSINNLKKHTYNDVNTALHELRDDITMHINSISANLELLHEMNDKNSKNICEMENNFLETKEQLYIHATNIMESNGKTNNICWGYYKYRSDNSNPVITLFGNENIITRMDDLGKICNKQHETIFYLDSLKFFKKWKKIDISELRNYYQVVDTNGNNLLEILDFTNTFSTKSKQNLIDYIQNIRPDMIIKYYGHDI
jgi:hypothetical protein